MPALKDWLDKLTSKQPPTPGICSWELQRRNEAYELLAQAQGRDSWIELSRHSNGFVREIAVRELCSHPCAEALVALIERLNDWVGQVRNLATRGVVNHYLSTAHTPALLGALESFMALAVQQRADHGPTLQAVREVLQSPQVRDEVYANFLTRRGKTARYLFGLLLENDPDPQTLLRSALAHRELTVRLLAVTSCKALPAEQSRPLLLQALAQPGAKVQVFVLHALLPLLDDPQPVLREALLNASPSIRSLARWAAPRHGLDARAVLAERLNQHLPTGKRQWLGVLGLAAELEVTLPAAWHAQALASAFMTVRQAAVRLLSDQQIGQLMSALDDPSDKVFFAAIGRLKDQPWAALSTALDARLDRDWQHMPAVRGQALFALRPVWQQLAYLLQRLDNEPAEQALWLSTIEAWCQRQYTLVDPVTAKAERAAQIEKLQTLAAQGLVSAQSIARVV